LARKTGRFEKSRVRHKGTKISARLPPSSSKADGIHVIQVVQLNTTSSVKFYFHLKSELTSIFKISSVDIFF